MRGREVDKEETIQENLTSVQLKLNLICCNRREFGVSISSDVPSTDSALTVTREPSAQFSSSLPCHHW